MYILKIINNYLMFKSKAINNVIFYNILQINMALD